MADPKGFLKHGREVATRRGWPTSGLGRGLPGRHRPRPAADHHHPGRSLHGLRHPVLPHRLPPGQPHPGVERPDPSRQLRRRDRAAARDEQLPRVHRPPLPRPVRDGLRARHQPAAGDDQADRGLDHRPRVGVAGRAPAAARVAVRQDGRRHRVGSGRPGRRPAADPRRPHGGRLRARRQGRWAAALRHPRVQDGEVAHRPAPGPDAPRGHRLPRRHRGRHRGVPDRAVARAVRRRGAGDGFHPAARPGRRRPRARRHPPGDGVPAAGQPLGARRGGRRPGRRHLQGRRDHRRRRHRRRLPRHRAAPGSRLGDAARDHGGAADPQGLQGSRGRRTR